MSHLKSLMGLVDKQAQLELDNVGLFAQTALFVREVLADPQKVKEFIKQMETLGVKMSPDLRKAAGINLTEKEKSKLGQSNMLLPMMRAIFHSKEGKLRSFENYAYPMTQLLKDESLVTLEQLRQAVDDAVYSRDGGKTLRGVEALRALERESRSASKTRSGSQSSEQHELSPRVALMDGITIASDYRAAVTSLDRGYEGASAPDTAPEEIGQGIARTMSVRRDGRWKDRIILDTRAAFALLAEESDTVEWGLYLLVRQLTEVAISEMIERQLPGVWMEPIGDPLHGFLYPSIHPAIFGYLASHISAGIGDPHHHASVKRELFITALGDLKSAGLAARLEYRHNGDLDHLLGIVMPRISYTLQFAADLLGHCAASGADLFDADGELSAALSDVGLQQWFPIFRDRLERLRMRLGRWESFDEFLAIDVHVERLMWQLGMLPWHGPEGVRIEIPLGTDIDKLLESTSH